MTKHFHDILIITRSINNFVLEGAPDFSHLGELINLKDPQEADVRWAIKQLNVNKAADSLGLQAEMFKACVKHEKGKTFELVGLMTQTLQRLWKGEEVPTSWLATIFIPLYKRKGARKNWNNWRGIVLLNIASKIHVLLLNRVLRDLADRLAPETQGGFRPEHGSADGLLVVRRVLESFRNMTGNDSGVFLLFVDLKKKRSMRWTNKFYGSSWKRKAVFQRVLSPQFRNYMTA